VTAPIRGWCDDRFAKVRDAFVENFRSRGEVGAGVYVQVDGTTVLDLVGGWADHDEQVEWQPDTLVDVYSVGKAFIGLLALELVDEGRLTLELPVAELWPEFGVEGKAEATIRHALSHRAGVPAIEQPLSDEDLWSWETMTSALAATPAWWPPGTAHAYHTNTYGHLMGEIVRRTSSQMPSVRLAALVDALGVGDQVYVSVPDAELARCAEVDFVAAVDLAQFDPASLPREARMVMLSYFNPPGYSSMGVVNTTRWRQTEIPSTNTHATARGIGAIYGALLEEDRIISHDLLAEATRAQSTGFCPVLGEEVSFGLGFVPTRPRRPFGPNQSSFGHFGTGGAVGFADPIARVSFGYAMNHVIPRWQSSRNRALIDAVYESL